jgi:ribosomal protein S11
MSTTHFPLVSTCFLNPRSIATNYIRVYRTFNNTTVVVTGQTGNVVTWSSAGACGFRGARKRAPFAAQVVAETVRAHRLKKESERQYCILKVRVVVVKEEFVLFFK